MYVHQKTQVRWNNLLSSQHNIHNGVKQGGCLSHNLFCVYVNHLIKKLRNCNLGCILSVYSPFSDRVGLPLHNIHIPSPFTSIMDIFFVDLKFGHIHFYTL